MEHSHHNNTASDTQKWLKWLAIGSALAAGAVIVAPYVLPVVGVGTAELTEEAMLALHATGAGSGLAGAINGAMAAIPGVGGALAAGGFATAATSAAIGIGGVLLGKYVEKRDDGTSRIRWGSVIKTAALLTSALIAMPSILTGISTGIVFLSAALSGAALASTAVGMMGNTLGSVGTASIAAAGVGGAALTLPHLLTCGSSIVPLCISWAMGSKELDRKNSGDVFAGRVEVDAPTQAGQSCMATIRLYHKQAGKPLSADELAVVHTQKLHLLVIDESLKDYHHIHPQPTAVPGEFSCAFTPATNNRYSAWADFTTLGNNVNQKLKMDVACASSRRVKPDVRMNSTARQDGLEIEMKPREPLENGKASMVDVSVRDASGTLVADLEPVMGAYAHLVGFSADGKQLIHCHPLGEPPANDRQKGQGQLLFHVAPDCEGPTQFFLQVKRAGKEVFVPFGQEIGRQAGFSGRIAAERAGEIHLAHAH